MFDKPFGPRSIASKVWYASVSPFAIGLVAFSFVMVAFGSTVYITSIPGMVVNDTPYVDPVINGPAAGASDDGGDDADGSSTSGSLGSFFVDGIDSLTSSYLDGDNSLGAGAVSIMKSGLTVPVLDLGGMSGSSDGSDDSSQGGASPDDNGGAIIPPDGSGPSIPAEPDKPSEPTEEEKQEMMIHDALVGAYNALPEHYEQVVDSYTTFNNNHATADRTAKYSYYTAANSLYGSLGKAFNEHMYVEGKGTIKVPSTSKYYSNAIEINALYDDLATAQYAVRTAWFKNWMGQQYLSVIQAECPNGQSTHLLDFVARYPGAAL